MHVDGIQGSFLAYGLARQEQRHFPHPIPPTMKATMLLVSIVDPLIF